MLESALDATDVCFVLTDPRAPDNPVVWVNPAFTRVTGWTPADIVGRNCRILQVPGTDDPAVAELREAVAAGRSCTVTVLNRRKDGGTFWNQLTVTPVVDAAGELVSYVGVQSDVTDRVRADQERVQALGAEQVARRHAERAQARQQLMAEGTSQLAVTLATGDLLARLVGLCVPTLAPWAEALATSESGLVTAVRTAHAGAGGADLHERSGATVGSTVPAGSAAAGSISTGRSRTDPGPTAGGSAPATRVLTVPMVARGHTLGVLTLGWGTDATADDDIEVAVDLGRRAALAMDNARLYQQESSIAETLQLSLLPVLPAVAGVTARARYQAASSTAAVGGDFYDLLDLPDGSVAVAIGDVAGHDTGAAAQMGQLRALLRACAYEAPDPDPAAVLDHLDRLVLGLQLGTLATVAYARAERPRGPSDGWRLHVATAGHPPLVLCGPDGTVRQLDEVHGLLLGVTTERTRTSTTVDVPRGTTVLAYTDGLVEHRGAHLDDGTDELLDLLRSLGPHRDPELVIAAAMTLADNRLDDVACIGVTLH